MNCSKLHELCQKNSWALPKYSTKRDGGPDHSPRFSGTVTLNGVSFATAEPCKTCKEARNGAAYLALKHFSDAVSSPASSTSLLATTSAEGSMQLKRTAEDDVDSTVVAKKLKGDQHLFKNQLQMYAHRNNLSIPMYSCESDGPPPTCRFKCKVTIGEHVFESPRYFSKIKDAQNAAAQVALMSLSPNGAGEDDSGFVKALLQGLALGSGLRLPCYITNKSGEDHMPIFVTHVEIGGETFKGEIAKTKKQAEISAARIAYGALKDRYSIEKALLPSSSGKGQDLNCSPSMLKANESPDLEQDVGSEPKDETVNGMTSTTLDPGKWVKQLRADAVSLASQNMLLLPQPTMPDGSCASLTPNTNLAISDTQGSRQQNTSAAYQSSNVNATAVARDEMKSKASLSPNTNLAISDAGGSMQRNGSDANQSSDVNVTAVARDETKSKASLYLNTNFAISDAGGSVQHNGSEANQSSDVHVTAMARDDKKLKGIVEGSSHQSPIFSSAAERKETSNTGSSSLFHILNQHSLSPLSVAGLSTTLPSVSASAALQTGMTSSSCERILVYPRPSDRKLEVTGLPLGDDKWVAIKLEGGTVLPLSDDSWVAVKFQPKLDQ